MDEVLIAIGVVALVLYLGRPKDSTASVVAAVNGLESPKLPAPDALALTPANPVPTALAIPSSVPVSGGYQTAPASTRLTHAQGQILTRDQWAKLIQSGVTVSQLLAGLPLTNAELVAAKGAGVTAAQLAAFLPPPALPNPPPYVIGGIGGGVGTGGNPLGGPLRPGISAGTGTTSVPIVIA